MQVAAMAYNQRWLTYDTLDPRPRGRRKWPWFLLLALLAGLVAVGWYWFENSEDLDLTQPVAIQAALPALLIDDTMVVYVVDDSGSLKPYLTDLRQAVQDVSQQEAKNSEVAMLLHGDYPTTVLFDFTSPSSIPWASTIETITAQSRTEWMYKALDEARQMLLDKPSCHQRTTLMFFERTQCLQKMIILIGDGSTSDPELGEATISKLEQAKIVVHTVYLGAGDQFAMQTIATRTEGEFVRVR